MSLGSGHYLRRGGQWKRGDIEFEYKQLEEGGKISHCSWNVHDLRMLRPSDWRRKVKIEALRKFIFSQEVAQVQGLSTFMVYFNDII